MTTDEEAEKSMPMTIRSESDGENVVLTIETQTAPHQLIWRGRVDPETAL